jgi:branched-chain amino acid transport system permease protein
MQRYRTLLIVLPVLVVLVLLPLGVDGYILGLLTLGYYYAVFAISWDLLFGFAGAR